MKRDFIIDAVSQAERAALAASLQFLAGAHPAFKVRRGHLSYYYMAQFTVDLGVALQGLIHQAQSPLALLARGAEDGVGVKPLTSLYAAEFLPGGAVQSIMHLWAQPVPQGGALLGLLRYPYAAHEGEAFRFKLTGTDAVSFTGDAVQKIANAVTRAVRPLLKLRGQPEKILAA